MTGSDLAQVMHVMDGNLRAQDNGRKRHIAVDTIGLLLTVLITAASVQDRDAAKPLLWNLKKAFPTVRLTWADGGYAGKLLTWAATTLKLTLQIVKRPDDLHTFKVLPRPSVYYPPCCAHAASPWPTPRPGTPRTPGHTKGAQRPHTTTQRPTRPYGHCAGQPDSG